MIGDKAEIVSFFASAGGLWLAVYGVNRIWLKFKAFTTGFR